MAAATAALVHASSPARAQEQIDAEAAAEEYFNNLDANWAKQAAAAEKGCAAGNMKLCVELGRAYSRGRGVPQDGAKALDLQKKACAAGESDGCLSAGSLLYLGQVVAKDVVKSAVYFEQACTAGDGSACFNLSAAYAHHTPAELQTACDDDAVRACDALGMGFYAGKGVARDTKRAADIFARACKLGWDASCANLGTLMLRGDGVAKDPQRALALLTRACDRDLVSACSTLGAVYAGGFGIAADKEKAAAASSKACAGGQKEACEAAAAPTVAAANAAKADALGSARAPVAGNAPGQEAPPTAAPATATADAKPETPRVLPPPGADGQQILDTCDANGAGAKNCFDLAHAYANGFGVEQNLPLSMVLFQKSCSLGHQAACKRAYGS